MFGLEFVSCGVDDGYHQTEHELILPTFQDDLGTTKVRHLLSDHACTSRKVQFKKSVGSIINIATARCTPNVRFATRAPMPAKSVHTAPLSIWVLIPRRRAAAQAPHSLCGALI
jgi:hypothetical protein